MILDDDITRVAELEMESKLQGDRAYCMRYHTYSNIFEEYMRLHGTCVEIANGALFLYYKLTSCWYNDKIIRSRWLSFRVYHEETRAPILLKTEDIPTDDVLIRDDNLLRQYSTLEYMRESVQHAYCAGELVDRIKSFQWKIRRYYTEQRTQEWMETYIKENNVSQQELNNDYELIKNELDR